MHTIPLISVHISMFMLNNISTSVYIKCSCYNSFIIETNNITTLLTFLRHELKGEPVYAALPYVTYQNLPILFVVTQMLCWLIGFRVIALDMPFSIISLLFCWSYLRFFYRFSEDGPAGRS